ncbi:MAG: hypothetical protein JWN40_1242 [Phycisphaerales bacterium]|nr:hypothetical protein [Phycisphaerales bacterium]
MATPPFLGIIGVSDYPRRRSVRGTGVVYLWAGVTNMTTLANPMFWNMKIKIAILTFATFAALC